MARKKIAGILLIAGAFLLLLAIFNLGGIIIDDNGDGDGFPDLFDRWNYECEVDILNEPFEDPKIQTFACEWEKDTIGSCLLNPQSIFASKGKIRLIMDNRVEATEDFEVTELTGDTFTLNANCMKEATYDVELQLRSDTGVLWDKKVGQTTTG